MSSGFSGVDEEDFERFLVNSLRGGEPLPQLPHSNQEDVTLAIYPEDELYLETSLLEIGMLIREIDVLRDPSSRSELLDKYLSLRDVLIEEESSPEAYDRLLRDVIKATRPYVDFGLQRKSKLQIEMER